MKKRLMSLLLTAAMIVSMVVVPVAAADPTTLTVGSGSAMPGQDIVIPVNITNVGDQKISSLGYVVGYDHNYMTVKSVTHANSTWPHGMFMPNSNTAGTIKVGDMSMPGSEYTGDNEMLTVTFTLAQEIPATVTELPITITVDQIMVSGVNIKDSVATVAGSVEVIFPATATTGEPQQTSITSAILNGSYTALDGVTVSASGIKWGTAEDALNNTVDFGAEVTGTKGSTIYYQAYATVAGVDYVGEIKSITLDGPKASEIEIAGAESITVTLADSQTTYTAAVKDQFGADYAADVTWSMDAYEGVSIDNGVVTVTKDAQSGTVTITATAGEASDTFEIAIDRPAPEANEVAITAGASEITLPSLAEQTTTATYTAEVKDQFGLVMEDADISWAVPMMDGVSIAEDGTLTVTTEAGEVDFTVYAQCDMARGEFPVSIKKAASVATAISFAEDTATMTIPTDDNNKVETFTAAVTDQYGVEMPAEIAYTFATADEFVTADKNTVTVKKGATAGTTYTLTATSGTLTDTLTITVVDIDIVWDYTVATDAVYGDTWADIVTINSVSASLGGDPVDGEPEIVDADIVPGAGEQTFTLKFISDDGVYVVTKTDVANIAKQVVTVKWTGYKGLTYGDPININATSDVELTTSEVKSNAGTHTVTASIAKTSDAANYELDDTAALEYTIAKAKATITVPAQTIRASKTSEQLAAQIGTIQADGVNGEKLDGILTVTDDISGKTPSTKAQKVKVSFAHTNENYETPVSGTVMVTFTEGDPQEISVNSVNATYGDAAVANAATVTKGGTGAITYASDNESVATVAADGSVNIVGVGTATVTVTVAAEGDWAETSTTYAVTVAPKAVTVSGITAADKVYDATTDAVVDVTNAVVEDKVDEDDVTVASAKGAFADANVGEGKDVAITDIVLTGAAVKNYVLSDAAVSATAKITKADPTIEFEGLKQKPGNVEAVTAVVTPASEGVTVVVEYYIAPVEEVACDHVGDKLCTTDGSACQHTDCGCSYVAPADGYWTTDVSLIQEKGEYPVRAYTEGDANLNAITVENAVTDTLVVKKSSSGGGGSVVEPPVVEPEISFADVTEDDWFYDYVIEAVENGLFAGTDEDHFSPDMQMNRAMMVTVMAALEFGAEGAPVGESDFTDLTADWYKNAVAWAADEKVTAGISDTEFGPDLALTREQVAVFLYAYAQLKGYDVSSGSINDIVSFNDIADLSGWATTAMQWACAEGLLEGTPEGDLLPKAVATRAQVAVILTNFEKMIND